jgi:hypothetical protein
VHVSEEHGDYLIAQLGQLNEPSGIKAQQPATQVVATSSPKKPKKPKTSKSVKVLQRLAKARAGTAKLLIQLRRLGVRHFRRDREHKFHPTRRWKFDLSWPGVMVAVEIQGMGSHQRASQFKSDCEKFSNAFAIGWTVVPVTHMMIADGSAAALIAAGIAMRKAR